MSYTEDFYWESQGRREQSFSGYYSHTEKLKNFTYEFKYTWSSNEWYSLTSDSINYSSNIGLTLNRYTTSSSYSINITQDNIDYAKEQFNYVYEWLIEGLAIFE
jgi:hypothetical protein